MIVHRTWLKFKSEQDRWPKGKEKRVVEGWFLFGVIPLYVRTRTFEHTRVI
jgi:hypothetical protein